MFVADLEEALEVLVLFGAPADAQKVNDLDEQARFAAGVFADGVDEALEAVDRAVGADAQERAGRDVADAGGFDDEHAGPALGKARVPVEHVLGDFAGFVGAPRDHGGHPGAALGGDGAEGAGLEQARGAGLFGSDGRGGGDGVAHGGRAG